MKKLRNVADVASWRLCIGCGACAYVCPSRKVRLVDFLKEGIRPVLSDSDCESCNQCLEVCPGVESRFNPALAGPGISATTAQHWGPTLGVWEGHAADPSIRSQGSSGGALTALAAYCLEVLGMYGVLHPAQDPQDPIRNRTRLSRSRSELVAACGSRYSPASVCNGLGLVESSPSPCVIIGKPSEIAAVRNAERLRPALSKRIGVTLSFFCAETPSTRGTQALLEKLGLDPSQLKDLRYRGHGWPGHFAPVMLGAEKPAHQLTYRESWSFIQSFRPWAAHQWPDGSGETADISCGDPWYEQPDGKNPGSSLVVARTQKGMEIVQGAIRAGYVELKEAEDWKITRSQDGLLRKKGAIHGRRIALRLAGLPVTRFPGFDFQHAWDELPLQQRTRSIIGTLLRIFRKGLTKPLALDSAGSVPVKEPLVENNHRLKVAFES